MLKDIVRPELELEITYGLRFFVDACGGYEFPCDADGNVKLNQMTETAIENYKDCLAHSEKFPYAYNEVHENHRWIKDSPFGTCHCGEKVYLENQYMGACQCPKCGQWYNLFGQDLLPPDGWEEEYIY